MGLSGGLGKLSEEEDKSRPRPGPSTEGGSGVAEVDVVVLSMRDIWRLMSLRESLWSLIAAAMEAYFESMEA
ncbi:hypothetical protein COLO4_28180 [Corchorus olitorius]|uniref:Uncharacterized protein n=1 Tax=Corchorus olitorius TaxID=93759 RepID=A0A1R3HMM1_9ROSI|nr:hypothetical protein COLO4_28180 [Corchorus olitorius]